MMAAEIHLRFYEELNDYLPADKRKREFAYQLDRKVRIQEVLQALGVPETEVELVLVNGSSAGLSRFLRPEDRVSIYPVFESLDVKQVLKIRRMPLRHTRFIITDSALYRLASHLRFLGFNVLIESPVCVAELAEKEQRILLTTDPAFLKSGLARVYVVRKKKPKEQLNEVISRFNL